MGEICLAHWPRDKVDHGPFDYDTRRLLDALLAEALAPLEIELEAA